MPETTSENTQWATTVLKVLQTPYPWASAHMSTSPDDCDVTPERLHPAFHGSLDWHSSAHMQWSAITLASRDIDPELRETLMAELDSRLTVENCQIEADYLTAHPGWERPYGWGWVIVLAAAINNADKREWATAIEPIVDAVANNLMAWLPKLAYPIRHGVHSNTAFGLTLARGGFSVLGRTDVVAAIDAAVTGWFLKDVDYPSRWEPSGADFISPALCEADLVRRVLGKDEFAAWLNAFLPGLAEPDDNLLDVPVVLDPTDGHAVHLYGLALSRATQLRSVAASLDEVRRDRALEAADKQFEWARQAISGGDFMSTHWLVSFALLDELANN